MATAVLCPIRTYRGLFVPTSHRNPRKPEALPSAAPSLHAWLLAFAMQPWQPTRSNPHSLNSWPAVQCNGGFCNALDGHRSILTAITTSQKPHHSANDKARQNLGHRRGVNRRNVLTCSHPCSHVLPKFSICAAGALSDGCPRDAFYARKDPPSS